MTQVDRDQANALITQELKKTDRSRPHASLPPIDDASFSELATKEIDRAAAGKKRKGGIDLERYEIPEQPSTDADTKLWRKTLQQAYSSSTYLSGRQVNLKLLEEMGKNAWLISNSQLEHILKQQEQELERLKMESESINKERKLAQEGSKGEFDALEHSWRRGIDELVKVQLATDNLRQELLQRTKIFPR